MGLHKTLVAALCAGVLALGLAGCGGGGGSGGGDAAAQRMAVAEAIGDARDAVDALAEDAAPALLDAALRAVRAARDALDDADALSDAEKDAHATTLSLVEDRLAAARMRFAEGEAAGLRAALDGAPIAAVAARVAHGAAPVLSGTIPGTPPVAVAGLVTGAVAGTARTVGGWSGGEYRAADAAAGTADRIVLYSDVEAPGTRPFSGEGGKYSTANGLDADGNLPIAAGVDATLIAAAAFPTGPGIRTHDAGADGTVSLAGTFDGAAGTYACTPAMGADCTSSIRAGGGFALAGGTDGWIFVPDAGAMAARPDADYSWFGWWQRAAGGSYAFAALHGGAGDEAADFADFAALQGTATYRGPAAGRYVLDPVPGAAEAGDFTASATLQVDFADAADAGGVTGTIDGFVADDGARLDWSVALGPAALGANGAIGAGTTVWTIDGREGAAPGAPGWSGNLRDVDADRVPRTATGTFDAAYGEVGRLSGAFGATRAP